MASPEQRRWPWLALALATALWMISLWPDDEGAHFERTSLFDDVDAGRLGEPVEDAREVAAISGASPPLDGRRRRVSPHTHSEPDVPEEPPPAAKETTPIPPTDPLALFAPPGPPMLPIWAYDGAVAMPEGAPTGSARTFDPSAPERAVMRALRRRDAKLGLDLIGAGRVATLLAAAVRGRTPPVSVGTFVARVSSDGEIFAIALSSFSGGDHEAWSGAGSETLTALHGVRLSMPGHLRHGARVTVRITQDTEHPSGRGRRPNRKKRALPEKSPTTPGVPKPGRKSRREEPIVSVKDLLPPDLQGLGDPETMLPPCNVDGSGCNEIPWDVVDIGTSAARIVRTFISVAPVAPLVTRRGDVNKRTRPPRRSPTLAR